MRRRLELLDTSVVLELLQVPFESDRHEQTLAEMNRRTASGIQFQFPVAAIVETGAHVGRIANGHHRRLCANRFERILRATIDNETPWSFTALEWDETFLGELVDPSEVVARPISELLAKEHLEMGDATIIAEFRRIRDNLDASVVELDIWTYDAGLRSMVDGLLHG